MDIKVIEYFLDIASGKTFSEVSAGRGISTSSLSKQIKAMETELGVKLFAPSGRRVVLTAAGRALTNGFSAMHEQYDNAVKAAMRTAAQSELWLTASPNFSFAGINEAVVAFEKLYGIHVKCGSQPRSSVVAKLSKGECDLALMYFEKNDKSFVKRPVFDDQVVALCSYGSGLAGRKSLSMQEIMDFCEKGKKVSFDMILRNLLADQFPDVYFPHIKDVGYLDAVERTLLANGVVLMLKGNCNDFIMDMKGMEILSTTGFPSYQFCVAHRKSAKVNENAQLFFDEFVDIYRSIINGI